MSETLPARNYTAQDVGSDDGSQSIVNSLKSRSIYNAPLERRRKKDKVKSLRSFFESIDAKSIEKLPKLIEARGQIISELCCDGIQWDTPRWNHTPGCRRRLADIIEPWLEACYRADQGLATMAQPTGTSTYSNNSHGNYILSVGSYAQLMSRLALIVQNVIKEDEITLQFSESPDEDQLFNALMADIVADNPASTSSSHEKKIARDWLDFIAARQ